MRVVGLVSGGKDSTYNLCKCVDDGHQIVALANLYPKFDEAKDELDSFMYQTVGHQAIGSIAEALDVPLFRREISGTPLSQTYTYDKTTGDEVEDLFELLLNIKNNGIEFDAISVGAIHSNYQGNRAQNICDRLNLKMLAYLWERDQVELLQEMINYGMNAILIKVAVIGLNEQHLGKSLEQMQPILLELKEKYGINVCGEGGEFESLTLDCPLFKRKLHIEDSKIIVHSNDAFAAVSYMRPLKISLKDKN